MLEDGGDDDELRPLEGVRGGVEDEEEEHQPTATVQQVAGLELVQLQILLPICVVPLYGGRPKMVSPNHKR